MAFFQVAYDGSGTFSQHAAIAYAGAIASTRQWSAFTESWNKILEREKLPYFKMAEAMTWSGRFLSKHDEWGNDRDNRRNILLHELADLAVQHDFRSTGMWSDARVMANEDAIVAKKIELFKGAVFTLLSTVPTGNFATLMIDDEFDIEPRLRGWIRQMRTSAGDGQAPIVAVCFVDDRAFPAIQLADMIAWLFRELGEQIIASDGENLVLNPLLDKLMHSSHFTVHKTEPGALLNGFDQSHSSST